MITLSAATQASLQRVHCLLLLYLCLLSQYLHRCSPLDYIADIHAVPGFDCDSFLRPILTRRDACLSGSNHHHHHHHHDTSSHTEASIIGTIVDVCVTFNSEYEFILPFLVHHLSMGVNHIVIYNNDIYVEWLVQLYTVYEH